MEKNEIVFMEIVFMILVIVWLGFIYLHVSHSLNLNEQVVEKAGACEKSGGVYIDNMRRVGKRTDHEYVCMNKSMFIFPEGEK